MKNCTPRRQEKNAYSFSVLECIKHFKIATALTAGNMLPEAINSCNGQQPLRVNLPCLPAEESKE